eukprot:m.91771 g.91771  ORF g.91771 m.91771 type:complete len:404 (-) comp12961_c0_seq1:311-1522(-)
MSEQTEAPAPTPEAGVEQEIRAMNDAKAEAVTDTGAGVSTAQGESAPSSLDVQCLVLIEELKQACALYLEDKVMQARCIVDEVRPKAAALLKEKPVKAPVHPEDPGSPILELENMLDYDETISQIVKYSDEIASIRQMLATEEGWTLQGDSDETRTYYKADETNALHTIRVEGWADNNVFDLLAILYEVDMHPDWMPSAFGFGITESVLLSQFSATKLLVDVLVRVPWPFDNRSVGIFVNGIDCLDQSEDLHRQVVIMLRSGETDTEFMRLMEQLTVDTQPKKPERSGTTEMELKHGAIILTPAEVNPSLGRSTGTLVQMIACIDPKMASMPSCAINLGIKSVAHFFIDSMRKQAALVPTHEVYQSRIAANDAFYGFLRRRMEESGYGEALSSDASPESQESA